METTRQLKRIEALEKRVRALEQAIHLIHIRNIGQFSEPVKFPDKGKLKRDFF